MKILAIETSCDETALSILECSGGLENPVFEVLANKVVSQIDLHKEYGGVYPTLAKREHAKNLLPVLLSVLEEAGQKVHESQITNHKSQNFNSKVNTIQKILEREPDVADGLIQELGSKNIPNIDLIAVTNGPGLAPALWIGVNFANALSILWDKPAIPINHMEGHLLSILWKGQNKSSRKAPQRGKQITNHKIPTIQFPLLGLLVSGGHTELVYAENFGEYKKIGMTRDDAVGEAFDKVARMLGLEYPGGPKISALAVEAREQGLTNENIVLPRPMMHSKDYDFSYSGLKTAVMHLIEKIELTEENKKILAREFEDAAVDVLVYKTKQAIEEYHPQTLIIGGGVTANTELRTRLTELTQDYENVSLILPEKEVTMDNAIMIGITGYINYLLNPQTPSEDAVAADANLSL